MNQTCGEVCGSPLLCDEGVAAYEEAIATGPFASEAVPPCLRRLGLVSSSGSEELRPVPPGVAAAHHVAPLERELSRRRDDLAGVAQSFEMIENAYKRGRSRRLPDVALLQGETDVEASLQRSLDECRAEFITAHPGAGRSPEILSQVLERDLPVLRRGVRKRVIYQHTIRTHGPTLDYIECIVSEGGETRTLSELFDRLIVFDRQVAYVSCPSRAEHSLVEIRQPALVHYLSRAFEVAWGRATPLPTRPRGDRSAAVIGDLQRSIMRMLVSGFTDDRIARELGMGRRTVSEHVRRLSERFGSSSRAQLGYAIAVSGELAER